MRDALKGAAGMLLILIFGSILYYVYTTRVELVELKTQFLQHRHVDPGETEDTK